MKTVYGLQVESNYKKDVQLLDRLFYKERDAEAYAIDYAAHHALGTERLKDYVDPFEVQVLDSRGYEYMVITIVSFYID